MSVMNEFSKGNYSMDSLTAAGLAKIYYTENYFYEVTYSNHMNNVAYIKDGNSVYEASILNGLVNVNTSIDLGGENGIKLPGCGDYYFANNDLGYISHFDEGLYDASSYRQDKICGVDVWKLTNSSLSKALFDYIMVSDQYKNMGVGFIVSKGEDTYDTRVTLLVAYLTPNGYEGYATFTFYDVGGTSFEVLDNYLK